MSARGGQAHHDHAIPALHMSKFVQFEQSCTVLPANAAHICIAASLGNTPLSFGQHTLFLWNDIVVSDFR